MFSRAGQRLRRHIAPCLACGLGVAVVAACRDSGGLPRTGASQSTGRAADPRPAVPPSAAVGRRTVLIEGTSLTAGLGLDPADAFPALLQQKIDSARLPFVVVNAGVSGETSAGALQRIGWLMRGPVDVFVLETGANDGLRGLDVDSLRGHLVSIIRAVRHAHPAARICLVQMEAPPNLGSRYAAAFHAVYPAVARQEGATLVPFLLRGVADRPELNQADGIHPNRRGEGLVAATVWAALAPVLRRAADTAAVGAGDGADRRGVDGTPVGR